MKKILILNTNLIRGGIERQISYLVNVLNNKAYEIHLVYYARKNEYTFYNKNVHVKYMKWIFGFARCRFKYIFYPFFFFRLILYILKEKPNVLHSYGPIENITLALVKKILKTNIIVSVRTTANDAFRLAGFWVKAADKIVTNAKSISEILEKKFDRYKNKIVLIPNGIDRKAYRSTRIKKNNTKQYTYTLVGRISGSKNQLIALKAFKEVKKAMSGKNNLNMFLIGKIEDREYYKKIREYITENELEKDVMLLEWKPNIVEVLEETNCIILPSKTEGTPNIILEAMAFGIPWIAFDVADVKYLAGMKHKRGIITTKNTTECLTKEMLNILKFKDKELTLMMENGKTYIEENHSLDKLKENAERLYNFN